MKGNFGGDRLLAKVEFLLAGVYDHYQGDSWLQSYEDGDMVKDILI